MEKKNFYFSSGSAPWGPGLVCCGRRPVEETDNGVFRCQSCGRTWLCDREGQFFRIGKFTAEAEEETSFPICGCGEE